jgi:hypothetical protein
MTDAIQSRANMARAYATAKKPATTTTKKTTSSGGKVSLRDKTRVLKAPKVQLIFWGNWAGANPSTAQVDSQFRNLMSSGFFSKLSQYGGGSPTYLGSIQTTATAPSGFTDAQVISQIGALITAGKMLDMRKDGDVIYVLLPPKGVKAADKTGDAYHIDFTWGGASANFAVYYGAYDLASMMKALSEEIAETIVDPWQTSSGDQIGDLCENVGTVNGVTVEGYWSNSDNGCVIPGGSTGTASKGALTLPKPTVAAVAIEPKSNSNSNSNLSKYAFGGMAILALVIILFVVFLKRR